jgi:hypothetical protein
MATGVESAIVPVPVIVPPVNPVPATILVTVPPELGAVFVTVTPPVLPESEIPVPALRDVTPAFVSVTELPSDTAPPPLIPVPAVTVTDEWASCPFVIVPVIPLDAILPATPAESAYRALSAENATWEKSEIKALSEYRELSANATVPIPTVSVP